MAKSTNRPSNQIFLISVGGARGAMVIVVGTEHGDTSSNLGRD